MWWLKTRFAGKKNRQNGLNSCEVRSRPELPSPAASNPGRSSAWLERLLWEQEVARSNRVAPIQQKSPENTSFQGFFDFAPNPVFRVHVPKFVPKIRDKERCPCESRFSKSHTVPGMSIIRDE
jgi:hypothetical protein